MKKIFLTLVLLLSFVSLVGCDSANIAVGVEDGVAYFHTSTSTPQVVLKSEKETEINDATFFENLVSAIDGKPAVNDVCNCKAIYNIKIEKYSFGLHTHGISISSPIGHNIKGVNIFTVECTEEEMNALFSILESII